MSQRILFGKWPAGSAGSGFGLRIAQAGYQAAMAADANLNFSSDWGAILPILQQGSVTLTTGVAQTIGFPSPGYVPFFNYAVNFTDTFETQYWPMNGVRSLAWRYAPFAYKGDNNVPSLQVSASSSALTALYNKNTGVDNTIILAYTVYRLATS